MNPHAPHNPSFDPSPTGGPTRRSLALLGAAAAVALGGTAAALTGVAVAQETMTPENVIAVPTAEVEAVELPIRPAPDVVVPVEISPVEISPIEVAPPIAQVDPGPLPPAPDFDPGNGWDCPPCGMG